MIGTIRGAATALLGGLALTLAVAGGGSAAHAQSVDLAEQHDYAVKAGLYIPSNKDVRRAGGDLDLALEADMVIQRFPERNMVSLASVGFIERGDFRMIPLTVSQVYRDPGSSSHYNYYYGYGLGLYPTRLSTPDGVTSNSSKILFGGFIVTGIDLTTKNFVEMKYHYISKYDSKQVGGFQLTVGQRF